MPHFLNEKNLMSRTLIYIYKTKEKQIPFAYDQFRTLQEAVAHAENIDISDFLKMEQQVELVSSDKKAAKNYRDNYFKQLGFGYIGLAPKENRGIGEKPKR
jgi:hypothetical protein